MAQHDYLFVQDENKGWWLKIDTVEKLTDYYEHIIPTRYEGAISLYHKFLVEKEKEESVVEFVTKKPLEERIPLMQTKDFKLMYAGIMKAEKQDGATFIDGLRMMNFEIAESDMKYIREDGAVYFNPVGGKTYSVNYKQFCRRESLMFPHFTKDDIRIKQWEGGKHWYAFVGELQVRDGDIIKWDTYDEAYDKAYEIITED